MSCCSLQEFFKGILRMTKDKMVQMWPYLICLICTQPGSWPLLPMMMEMRSEPQDSWLIRVAVPPSRFLMTQKVVKLFASMWNEHNSINKWEWLSYTVQRGTQPHRAWEEGCWTLSWHLTVICWWLRESHLNSVWLNFSICEMEINVHFHLKISEKLRAGNIVN